MGANWNFQRAEGAPKAGLWVRNAINDAPFSDWVWLGMVSRDTMFGVFEWGEVLGSDEAAMQLDEALLRQGTEQDVYRCVSELAWCGRPVITSCSVIEFEQSRDYPYASPRFSEIDHDTLRFVSRLWMGQ